MAGLGAAMTVRRGWLVITPSAERGEQIVHLLRRQQSR